MLRKKIYYFTGIENLGYQFTSKYHLLPLGSSTGNKQPRMHYIDELDESLEYYTECGKWFTIADHIVISMLNDKEDELES